VIIGSAGCRQLFTGSRKFDCKFSRPEPEQESAFQKSLTHTRARARGAIHSLSCRDQNLTEGLLYTPLTTWHPQAILCSSPAQVTVRGHDSPLGIIAMSYLAKTTAAVLSPDPSFGLTLFRVNAATNKPFPVYNKFFSPKGFRTLGTFTGQDFQTNNNFYLNC
jgi:hypothetical protein